jgi:hypothetical protein
VYALAVVLACAGAPGCEQDCKCSLEREDAGPGTITVEIGTPGGDDELDFVRLARGGEIPLETFGQGGTHATLAVRARGLGTNRAFFDVSVENALTGATVSTVPSTRPQLWICDDARDVCDYLPIHVMTGGLAPIGIENRDGLHVIVTADVRSEHGRHGSGRQEGVLDWRPPPPRDGGVRDGGRDEDGGGEDLDAGGD